jgi:hypothetical protein
VHELNAARDLRRSLCDVDLHRPADRPTWLISVRRVIHRFGPRHHAWPTALSCLALKPPTSEGLSELVLVSAPPHDPQYSPWAGVIHEDTT